ncbi:unnamed protein product [Rhizoctonia solani]|uniref:Uncharacterized protein n=1 Tax=Rhizoctonia solani TaxID=456999 RepID=A0A8H3D839_9AGAM|nr:unnamed protein product [Rhizoctonia solani]
MKNFTLPDDPLLDEAAAAPSPDSARMSPEPHDEGSGTEDQDRHDGDNEPLRLPNAGSDEGDANAPNMHKRPRLTYHGGERIGGDSNHNHLGPLGRRDNMAAAPNQASLRQYAPGLVSSKKLTERSVQELHRFATSSVPEREMMAFGLNLEMRDMLETVSNAIVSTGVHPDLRKHIKIYTAALFFSPSLPYYSAPRVGTRNKELQRTVLRMLNSCQIANIPPPSNLAATEKVLNTIGNDLTDLRSNVKLELGKRKQGASNVDLGSFVATLTRNTAIKVTKEHYGRVAFLSREYRRWDSRDTSAEGGLANIGFWDWVDSALNKARKKYKNQPTKVNNYITSIIDQDEHLFNKAVGKIANPEERDDWQRQIEEASGVLPIVND